MTCRSNCWRTGCMPSSRGWRWPPPTSAASMACSPCSATRRTWPAPTCWTWTPATQRRPCTATADAAGRSCRAAGLRPPQPGVDSHAAIPSKFAHWTTCCATMSPSSIASRGPARHQVLLDYHLRRLGMPAEQISRLCGTRGHAHGGNVGGGAGARRLRSRHSGRQRRRWAWTLPHCSTNATIW